MSATVLIAAAEHLPALRQRDDLTGATVFADTEALRALDAITRQRPAVVALERLFAATSRGTALINRIKADPALASCDIRIIGHSEPFRSVAADAEAALPADAPAAPAALDVAGTRAAPRVHMREGVEILIDGNPAALVDLSLAGAQVLSPGIIRPNQRLRVSLGDPAGPIRMTGSVAWASFEMPKSGPRYRAGIEFVDPDASAITRFCNANKQD